MMNEANDAPVMVEEPKAEVVYRIPRPEGEAPLTRAHEPIFCATNRDGTCDTPAHWTATLPPATYNYEVYQPGCHANGTVTHPRCNACDYCHEHAPEMALAAHEQLAREKKIEAYGRKGTQSKPWRKTFKNQAAFEKWLEKNEGDVTVDGTRDAE